MTDLTQKKRELMPLYTSGAADVDEQQLHAEDIAFGEYLLSTGKDYRGMFHRHCTAAALRERKRMDALCDAIRNFDLKTWIGRLNEHRNSEKRAADYDSQKSTKGEN